MKKQQEFNEVKTEAWPKEKSCTCLHIYCGFEQQSEGDAKFEVNYWPNLTCFSITSIYTLYGLLIQLERILLIVKCYLNVLLFKIKRNIKEIFLDSHISQAVACCLSRLFRSFSSPSTLNAIWNLKPPWNYLHAALIKNLSYILKRLF